jgi:hypothetical protein
MLLTVSVNAPSFAEFRVRQHSTLSPVGRHNSCIMHRTVGPPCIMRVMVYRRIIVNNINPGLYFTGDGVLPRGTPRLLAQSRVLFTSTPA